MNQIVGSLQYPGAIVAGMHHYLMHRKQPSAYIRLESRGNKTRLVRMSYESSPAFTCDLSSVPRARAPPQWVSKRHGHCTDDAVEDTFRRSSHASPPHSRPTVGAAWEDPCYSTAPTLATGKYRKNHGMPSSDNRSCSIVIIHPGATQVARPVLPSLRRVARRVSPTSNSTRRL
jgi:hypothetical protein